MIEMRPEQSYSLDISSGKIYDPKGQEVIKQQEVDPLQGHKDEITALAAKGTPQDKLTRAIDVHPDIAPQNRDVLKQFATSLYETAQ